METSKMQNKEQSIVYWSYKNKIPLFSPAFTDGSIGDMIFFFRQQHKDFFVDISQDMDKIISITLNAEKTGVICLGGGSAKHYTLNAQIFRDGTDFAVYINSHGEDDASDSGADTSEAVTWTKIKVKAPQIKVHGDASIIFPLLVAGAFADK
jgi:deoxyhypusine synthase